MLGNSMMSVINKTARITKNTTAAIDHIFINSVTTTKFKTGIIKSDISDHFLIFFVADYNIHIKETKKRSHVNFHTGIFSPLYDECFPKKKIKLEPQKYNNPWITKRIKNPSKRKHELQEKFLKTEVKKTKVVTFFVTSYKSHFESDKRKFKRIYYSSKLLEFTNNARKTWDVMKEVIGKIRNTEASSPKKHVFEKKETTKIKYIAEEFNNFFTIVGPRFAKKVSNSSNSFTSFLNQTHTIKEKKVSINELKEAFFSLKTNRI